MSEREAFVRAVCEEPDDDTVRLVYADWLQERGDEDRAWLIRFQCDPRNQGTHDGTREYDLIERNIQAWFHLSWLTGRIHNRKYRDWYLRDYGPPNLALRSRGALKNGCDVELSIRRGFFRDVRCPARWWLEYADKLLAEHPLVRVAFTTEPRATGKLNDFALWKNMQSGEPWRSHRWPSLAFQMPGNEEDDFDE